MNKRDTLNRWCQLSRTMGYDDDYSEIDYTLCSWVTHVGVSWLASCISEVVAHCSATSDRAPMLSQAWHSSGQPRLDVKCHIGLTYSIKYIKRVSITTGFAEVGHNL